MLHSDCDQMIQIDEIVNELCERPDSSLGVGTFFTETVCALPEVCGNGLRECPHSMGVGDIKKGVKAVVKAAFYRALPWWCDRHFLRIIMQCSQLILISKVKLLAEYNQPRDWKEYRGWGDKA